MNWGISLAAGWLLFLWLLPFVSLAQFEFLTPGEAPALIGTVEVMVEADTRVPAFYQGRAEPAPGSTLRLVAIPQLTATSSASTSTLKYRWRVASRPLDTNESVATVETSQLSNKLTVGVQVFNDSGALLASNEQVVLLSDPEVVFYEDNPLRGLSRMAIPDTYYLAGNEVAVRGELFFFSPEVLTGGSLRDWSVNGRPVDPDPADPWSITLQNAESTDPYQIKLTVQNTKQLLQQATKQFTFVGNI